MMTICCKTKALVEAIVDHKCGKLKHKTTTCWPTEYLTSHTQNATAAKTRRNSPETENWIDNSAVWLPNQNNYALGAD